jgi:hypothetical protein
MCKLLEVHRSGFYAWLKEPECRRAREDKYFLGQIKQFWLESGCAYGYRNIHRDLKDAGESIGKNKVHRIMKHEKIFSRGIKCQTRERGTLVNKRHFCTGKLILDACCECINWFD